MLEKSLGVMFFLKTPQKKQNVRSLYLRITVDGISKETSTKRKWDVTRWNQKAERAIGNREDARSLNYFIETLQTRIANYRTELISNDHTITSQKLIDFVKGQNVSKAKLLEEFEEHNNEILALVRKDEYAMGTYERYCVAKAHVSEFIKYQYRRDDFEFRELNFQFVKNYELYLKTVRNCANNTALKYIANLKTIVLRAIAKEIILRDPFKQFKGKRTKCNKKPLTTSELERIENKVFSSERLTVARDVFIFQCYTGLAYIDAFQLKPSDIREGIDGSLWIMSSRQKSKSTTDIPLLPKAIEIMQKYQNHPLCRQRGTVLPVKSNQKMNEYLKEIAGLCGITQNLNTHKARRTFGSTVTLKNGVSIHVVKEMMGHHSVKQTEEYAITEQEAISLEMRELTKKLNKRTISGREPEVLLSQLKDEIEALSIEKKNTGSVVPKNVFEELMAKLNHLKELLIDSNNF